LGNQRAKLGVLTGQKVFGISRPIEIQEFINTDEQVLLVMREKDLREDFSEAPLQVLAEDIAWLRGRVGRDRLLELLWKMRATDASDLTEKIYLLSNK
jgi:hypothetical protein